MYLDYIILSDGIHSCKCAANWLVGPSHCHLTKHTHTHNIIALKHHSPLVIIKVKYTLQKGKKKRKKKKEKKRKKKKEKKKRAYNSINVSVMELEGKEN